MEAGSDAGESLVGSGVRPTSSMLVSMFYLLTCCGCFAVVGRGARDDDKGAGSVVGEDVPEMYQTKCGCTASI